MKYPTLCSVALFLCLPLQGVAQEASNPRTDSVEPLNVYLFARTVGEPLPKSEKKAREKELKSQKKELKRIREELYNALKEAHGKRYDDWPDEPKEQLRLALQAESLAEFERDYLRSGAAAKGKQKDLDDSLQDIVEAIQGKGWSREHKWITLVQQREQAQLIVELSDRASFRFRDAKVLVLTISLAEGLRSSQLDDVVPKEWDLVRVRHEFREEEPYWIVECGNTGNMWRNNAAIAASTLNKFIEDNHAALLGAFPPEE